MIDKKEFLDIVASLDGAPGEQLVKLVGDFDFSRYVAKVGKPDLKAGELPVTLRVPQIIAGFPEDIYDTPVRRMALEDYLARNFADSVEDLSDFDSYGVAHKNICIAIPGHKILPRTSLTVQEEFIEAHVRVRIPLKYDQIDAGELEAIFFNELQEAVSNSLLFCNLDYDELTSFLNVMEDAGRIRQLLTSQGLISFIGEGSIIRRDTYTDEPDFLQPDLMIDADLKTEMEVPNAGEVAGLGVKDGITLIIGDSYSGRSELLRAMASGIYNHVPGDGREFTASMADTVMLCEEPGRSVQKVDISAFVKAENEAFSEFSSGCATGFESEAAALVESIEAGARTFLFDEDTSSSAFLSAGGRVKSLIGADSVQTISLAERARQLVDELGVAIVVAGIKNVCDFIPIADTILLVEDYRVRDITDEAKELGIEAVEVDDFGFGFQQLADRCRWVVPSSIDPSCGKDDRRIEAYDAHLLEFGRYMIELDAIDQIADTYQTRTIGQVLYHLKVRYLAEARTVGSLLDYVDEDLSTEGLACLSPEKRGDMARPRRYEIAAAINRLPSIRIARVTDGGDFTDDID